MTLRKRPFENIVGKGDNVGNQDFRIFPKCFLSYQRQNHHLSDIYVVVCDTFAHMQNFVVWERINDLQPTAILGAKPTITSAPHDKNVYFSK